MKGAINIEGTKQLLRQIECQLGEIVAVREMNAEVHGLSDFRLSFEKPSIAFATFVRQQIRWSVCHGITRLVSPKYT